MEEEHFIEFSYNPDEGYIRIPIYDRYGVFKIAETIIDLKDLEKVRHRKWHLHYGQRGNKWIRTYDKNQHKSINMSHIILDLLQSNNSQIDYKDRDSLNNRRLNLRPCTNAQNLRNCASSGNSSKYKGISWDKRRRKWHARISVYYRRIDLGYFNDEEDAAKEYNKAAKTYFGEFAYLNKVYEPT